MNKLTLTSAKILVAAFAILAPLRVHADAGFVRERLNASINQIIQNVRETEDPALKRQMLENFLNRMDRGIGMAEQIGSKEEVRSLEAMRIKVQADRTELNGLQGRDRVADADLNRFANYIQQDMEQASYVYIGTGTLIIILLILLILL